MRDAKCNFQPEGVKFYDGIASGQQRSMSTRMQPPNVMISYATGNNVPVTYPNREYDLFVDSGGYTLMKTKGDYGSTIEEYLEYLEDYSEKIERYALRDYPCEPDLLEKWDLTVEANIERTVHDHNRMLLLRDQYKIDADPVAVLQGWDLKDYKRTFDRLSETGVIEQVDMVGVGSVCARKNIRDMTEIILGIREYIPERLDIHGFGLKRDALQFKELVDALDSVDSQAYDHSMSRGRDPRRRSDESFTWHHSAIAWLEWRMDLKRTIGRRSVSELDE